LGDILTEELQEEMDGEMEGETSEMVRESSQEPSGKKTLVKRVLGSKKQLFLILVIGGVLMGLLAGGWFFFFRGSPEQATLANGISATEENRGPIESGESGQPGQPDEIVFEDIVVLEPFERIPLKTNSAMGLISLDISLELMDPRYRKQVVSMQDRIRKIIMGQVREMRWLELRAPQGKIQLKYELLKRINSIFPKVMVRNIYFTNLIMQ
jgi:flagellar FliL protein